MQHQDCAMAMPLSIDRWGLVAREAFEAALSPPHVPRTAGGLSGRPTCRIYPRNDVWILELDPVSGGWVDDRGNVSRRMIFPTLAAAIGYAERKGLDYRIERYRPTAAAIGWRASHATEEAIKLDFKSLVFRKTTISDD